MATSKREAVLIIIKAGLGFLLCLAMLCYVAYLAGYRSFRPRQERWKPVIHSNQTLTPEERASLGLSPRGAQ